MNESRRRTSASVSSGRRAATAVAASGRAASVLAAAATLVLPLSAAANQGIVASAGEWLWPQLQARITVQTAALTPLSMARLADPTVAGARSVYGASLLGDYVFATPSLGNFRATSGVMLGSPGGAPMLFATPAPRVGVTVLEGGFGNGGSEGPSTVPYVGLGYSSAALWRSVSLSADVGLVAGRPAGLGGLGRAVLGNQAMDAAVRDLRLAPVLQLGVRYSF
jgi:hypothetical protein